MTNYTEMTPEEKLNHVMFKVSKIVALESKILSFVPEPYAYADYNEIVEKMNAELTRRKEHLMKLL